METLITPKKDKKKENTLSPEVLKKINAYWRAANYLSVGQFYLHQNPLLHESLQLENLKKMMLRHWGSRPGQNFLYSHLNRIINKYDLHMIHISGRGYGGCELVANTYLEGTYSEIHQDIIQDEAGLSSHDSSTNVLINMYKKIIEKNV